MVCNQLDEGRDPTAVEWIRHCERCGAGVWVKPLFVAQGYRITCFWCVPPGNQIGIHPQMLAELAADGRAQEGFVSLGEIRHWLHQRTHPRRHAT